MTRFDGENQINFSNNNQHWPLPFTWVNQITPFKDRLIVSAQIHGLLLFDIETGRTESLHLPDNIKSIFFATYFQDNIYFEHQNSLYAYNTTQVSTKLIAENLFLDGITTTDDQIYFITKNGLQTIIDGNLETIFTGDINVFTSISNSMVIADQNNIYFIHDNQVKKKKSLDSPLIAITNSNQNNSILAINERGNVLHFNRSDLNIIPNSYPLFNAKKVKKIYHDASEVLWVSSSNGVQRLTESKVKNHPKLFNVQHNTNEIIFIEDKLIVATYGDGLQTMDENSHYIHPQANSSFTKGGKRTMAILNSDNRLLLGTFDGVWSYEVNQPNAKKLTFEHNNNIVLKLIQDDDKLFIGTNQAGLKIYDMAIKKVIRHITKRDGLKNEEVIDILPLPNGDIWLATSNNVEIYNQITNTVRQTGISIPNKVISLNLVKNKVYATTKGSGILIFNLHGELLSRIAQGIDFAHANVIEDEIWISAKPGIYRLIPDNNQLSIVPGSEKYTFDGAPIKSKNNIYAWHNGGLLKIKSYKNNVFNANIKISLATISGQPLLNQANLKLASSNDVVTLTLASLDHREGNNKQFQYRINNSTWTSAQGDKITLTGLASGLYDIEIKGTNSLGQWSDNRAFASITVAYPWYWTLQMRVIYMVTLICVIALTIWLLYLRANSIKKVHQLLENELQSKGKRSISISRDLTLVLELLKDQQIDNAHDIITQSIETLNSNNNQSEPDCLYGNSLDIALSYFGEYLHKKYHITLNNQLEYDSNNLGYELQANIYKIVYEAVTSALLTGESRNFNVHIQEFKSKLWLSISDDENSFAHFNSKITFDMAMYYVRRIAKKYNASVNTFNAHDNKGSQLVISFPLLSLS